MTDESSLITAKAGLVYDKGQLNFDPRLRAASNEIKALLERYDVAGSIALASDSHAEMCTYFPKWSHIQVMAGAINVNLRIAEVDTGKKSLQILVHLHGCLTVLFDNIDKVHKGILAQIKGKKEWKQPTTKVAPVSKRKG